MFLNTTTCDGFRKHDSGNRPNQKSSLKPPRLFSICASRKSFIRKTGSNLWSSAYQKVAEGLDLVATHLEQTAQDIDLNEVLQKLPQEKPSN
jgi:hypothetical protein